MGGHDSSKTPLGFVRRRTRVGPAAFTAAAPDTLNTTHMPDITGGIQIIRITRLSITKIVVGLVEPPSPIPRRAIRTTVPTGGVDFQLTLTKATLTCPDFSGAWKAGSVAIHMFISSRPSSCHICQLVIGITLLHAHCGLSNNPHSIYSLSGISVTVYPWFSNPCYFRPPFLPFFLLLG